MDNIDINNILIDSFNTSLDLFGQPVKVYDNNNTFLFDKMAIVTPKNIINTDTSYQSYVSDLYEFSIDGLINYNYTIVYNSKKYKVSSVDDTKPYKRAYAKFDGVADTYNISLSTEATTVNKGNTYQIQATCYKNSVVVTGVVDYTSKDTSIATVNSSGLVTGVAEGTTQIVCSYNGLFATLNVTVSSQTVSYKMVVSDDGDEIVNANANGLYDCSKSNNLFFIGLVKDTDTVVTNNWINVIEGAYTKTGNIKVDVNYSSYEVVNIRDDNTINGAEETFTINYNNVSYSVTFKLTI